MTTAATSSNGCSPTNAADHNTVNEEPHPPAPRYGQSVKRLNAPAPQHSQTHTGGTDSNVKAAVIGVVGTLAATVLGGVFSIVTGLLEIGWGNNVTGEQAPKAQSTVTVTATATTTVTAEAAVPIGQSDDSSASSPPDGEGRTVHLSDLTPVGNAWLQGSFPLSGTRYRKSLAIARLDTCSEQWTLYELDRPYARFQATVGVSDNAERDDQLETVNFTIYADRNEDGEPDRDEQLGTRAATFRSPATFDVALNGTTRLILAASLEVCGIGYRTIAVWGDPRVIG
nr:hypothetical protein [Actinomycetales bacterium]